MGEVALMDVTPVMAAEWLTRRPPDQPLEKPIFQVRIRRYAEAMRNGEWQVTVTDPVKVTEGGGVVDGKLRLAAVIEAGVAVRMFVLSGLTPADVEAVRLREGARRTLIQAQAVERAELAVRQAAEREALERQLAAEDAQRQEGT
jgi:hypothetical protein